MFQVLYRQPESRNVYFFMDWHQNTVQPAMPIRTGVTQVQKEPYFAKRNPYICSNEFFDDKNTSILGQFPEILGICEQEKLDLK